MLIVFCLDIRVNKSWVENTDITWEFETVLISYFSVEYATTVNCVLREQNSIFTAGMVLNSEQSEGFKKSEGSVQSYCTDVVDLGAPFLLGWEPSRAG